MRFWIKLFPSCCPPPNHPSLFDIRYSEFQWIECFLFIQDILLLKCFISFSFLFNNCLCFVDILL